MIDNKLRQQTTTSRVNIFERRKPLWQTDTMGPCFNWTGAKQLRETHVEERGNEDFSPLFHSSCYINREEPNTGVLVSVMNTFDQNPKFSNGQAVEFGTTLLYYSFMRSWLLFRIAVIFWAVEFTIHKVPWSRPTVHFWQRITAPGFSKGAYKKQQSRMQSRMFHATQFSLLNRSTH